MKRFLILIIFPLFVIGNQPTFAQQADSKTLPADTVIIDSVQDMLITNGILTKEEWDYLIRQRMFESDTVPVKQRTSERKRKRMITNYRFVAKGDVAAGLAVSFANYETEDSQFFSLIEDFSGGVSAFAIKPFVAYFYNNNSCVGLKFSNTKINADLSSLYVDIDEDLNMELGRTGFSYSLNSISLIHRSYVGLDRGHRFGLFNETSLGYSWGDMDYTRTLASGFTETDTRINEFRLGLNPGLSVFVMDKFTVEASVGIAGLKMTRKRQTTNGERSGWRNTFGMDYKFNIFNIQIGLVAYL